MKQLLLLASLLGVLSPTLAAQDSDPSPAPQPTHNPEKQTPDVFPGPDLTELPKPDRASQPLSPKEKALLQSAYDGNLSEVQALVSKGISVDIAGAKERTPLMLAAYNGHTSVVEFLHGQGADVNAQDGEGKTALMYTCKRSFNDTAAFLLESGAEVNVRSTKKRITALMIAAVAGNLELAKMLLDHGADASLTDVFGNTAMSLAERKENSAVVDLLAESPAGG